MNRRHVASAALALAACLALPACATFGPDRLNEDQLSFSRALGDAEKQQTLLNIVRLRYADLTVFLDATQIISGYQLQRNVTGGFEVFPSGPLSTFLSGSGSVQLQQSPTFTFQPLAGENLAQSVLRPIGPVSLFPLIEGGLPVDVLFRLAVQSVGELRNTTALVGPSGAASDEFYRLLDDLRRMQIADLISIRIVQDTVLGPDGKPAKGPEHVFITLAPTRDPASNAAERDVRTLLRLPADAREAEIVYGRVATGRAQIPVLTRSMLGMLGQIAFQAEVPAADVKSGRTFASIHDPTIQKRPVVIVHSGPATPPGAFVAIRYGASWFWIDDADFDSKLAFLVVNVLLALSQTTSIPGTVITIPAG